MANSKSAACPADNQTGCDSKLTLSRELLAAIEAAAIAASRCAEGGRRRCNGDHDLVDDRRMAYSIAELGRFTSLGRQFLYDEIARGRLKVRKLGRRTLILRADAERWLAAAPAIEPAQPPDGVEQAPGPSRSGNAL